MIPGYVDFHRYIQKNHRPHSKGELNLVFLSLPSHPSRRNSQLERILETVEPQWKFWFLWPHQKLGTGDSVRVVTERTKHIHWWSNGLGFESQIYQLLAMCLEQVAEQKLSFFILNKDTSKNNEDNYIIYREHLAQRLDHG